MAANGVRKVQMRKRARGGSPDRVMMFSNGGGRLSGDQCVDGGRRLNGCGVEREVVDE
jgi:hypothetical protein